MCSAPYSFPPPPNPPAPPPLPNPPLPPPINNIFKKLEHFREKEYLDFYIYFDSQLKKGAYLIFIYCLNMVLPFSPITSVILFRQALDMNRVGKWSRVSRKTRLKIGLAISRDLKCKTCKTQKLAKIMHLGRFREGNKAIPHLTSFL